MSDLKPERRPKVTRFFMRDAVFFGGNPKLSFVAGDYASTLERTPGGMLVRYETPDGKGKKERRETFVPDSNIVGMDLEVTQ